MVSFSLLDSVLFMTRNRLLSYGRVIVVDELKCDTPTTMMLLMITMLGVAFCWSQVGAVPQLYRSTKLT